MTTFNGNGTEFCLEVVAADCCVVRRGCGCHGDGQRPDVLCAAPQSKHKQTLPEHSQQGHSCQVHLLYKSLGFFFCKVAGKNP